MPFSPGGIFSLVASYLATPGTNIRTEQHNPVFEDVASGLSQVLIRDGRAPMTGPLNMNGFQINNIAAGSDPNSVATLAQAMPIGAVIDFAGSIAPAGWLLCYGQAVSRTTFAALFAVIGTAFGGGDGSTTFNLPDSRGRTSVGKDDMGGSAANRMTPAGSGINGATLGAAGGAETHTLTAAQLAPHAHSGTTGGMNRNNPHSHGYDRFTSDYAGAPALNSQNPGYGKDYPGTPTSPTDINHEHSFTTNAGDGVTGAAHNNTQPSIIFNKIIRVSYDG